MERRIIIFCLICLNTCLSVYPAFADQPSVCTVPSFSDSIPALVQVNKLAALATVSFEQHNSSCALHLLQAASAIVNALPSSQQRTIAGYEIKDALYAAFEEELLSDASQRVEAIRLAVQSLTTDGSSLLTRAEPVERFNDGRFLLRLAEESQDDGRADEAAEYYIMALRLIRGLAPPYSVLSYQDLHEFPKWLYEQGAFPGLLRILKELPEESKRDVALRLMHAMRYGDSFQPSRNRYLLNFRAGQSKTGINAKSSIAPAPTPEGPEISYDRDKTLQIADDTERLITEFAALSAAAENMKPGKLEVKDGWQYGWDIRMRRFIWQSYLAAAEPEAAQRKLDAWLGVIRSIPYPSMRATELKNATFTIQHEGVSPELVSALRAESEREATLKDPAHIPPAPAENRMLPKIKVK